MEQKVSSFQADVRSSCSLNLMFLLNIKIEILVHGEKNSSAEHWSFLSFRKIAELPSHIYSLSSKLKGIQYLIRQIKFFSNILTQDNNIKLTHGPRIIFKLQYKESIFKRITTPVTAKNKACTHIKTALTPSQKPVFQAILLAIFLKKLPKSQLLLTVEWFFFLPGYLSRPAREFDQIIVQWLNTAACPVI